VLRPKALNYRCHIQYFYPGEFIMKNYQITQWCSRFIEEQVKEGDICIDATMGNGNDTLLLSRLAGPDGQVLAFDIQEQALQAARQKLLRENAPANYTLFLESHTHMADHVKPDSVSCIVFNFGYLPGGDHSLATRSETSIQALEQSLTLLKKGGLLSLCIYSGGDSGFEERDALLTWLKKLDSHNYLVIRSDYYNRPNNPPIPVLVIRLH
jgi:tRNA1(Val) A37 N6-methylase TrmN6